MYYDSILIINYYIVILLAQKFKVMKKVVLAILFSLLFASRAFAQYGEEVLGVTAELTVDKKIILRDGSLVDNLGVSDFHIIPSKEVTYKIRVINNTNKDLENVSVSDTLPSYVTFVKGPGTYDKNSRTLTFYISKILKNEIKEYDIKVKVYKSEELPADLGVYCVFNKVSVKKDEYYDDDTAQMCLEKPTIPPTGPSDTLFILLGSLVLISCGWVILKKAI